MVRWDEILEKQCVDLLNSAYNISERREILAQQNFSEVLNSGDFVI